MTEATDMPDLLARLHAAQTSLEDWERRVADDTSNNPEKHQSHLRAAREAARTLTLECKAAGLLPLTDAEAVALRLDNQFPAINNREVVAFEGAHYQRRFDVVQRSRSRQSVNIYEPYWKKLEPGSPELAAFLDPEGAKRRQALVAVVRKAWPFAVPAGGLVLSVTVDDEPGLMRIAAGKATVGWKKGYPDQRVSVIAELALTAEALEQLGNPQPPRAKTLFLGRNTAGRGLYLVKTGRGSADIAVEEGDPPAPVAG